MIDAKGKPGVEGCAFCGLAVTPPDEAQLVFQGDLALVVLNASPYNSGHLMVVPLRHMASLEDLTPDEASEAMSLMQRATTALKLCYAPEGLNVGMNIGSAVGAGLPGHLHVHVVPRWHADTSFLTTVAETRLVPEDLSTTLRRVRTAWSSTARDGSAA